MDDEARVHAEQVAVIVLYLEEFFYGILYCRVCVLAKFYVLNEVGTDSFFIGYLHIGALSAGELWRGGEVENARKEVFGDVI